ncbi:FG-GAP repeat protein [Pseudoalteromonas sp. P1-9]|uniref:FG-GAP repeat domain-containing protein n=1 Tax=Pseudoalteromonas sp. P1-9 TaxID=1710354 RepID=UPI0006D6212A|nr:VCBS repeat-containing protein [Pseudoalteromonas sp. P1-9]KPV98354.1 FG-GAP repeat protein [Pseudoalteromonas sp. P1-9]
MKIITALVVTLGFASTSSLANSKKDLFNEVAIETDLTLSHPVYPIDLLPNPGKELMLIGTDSGQQYIDIFAASEAQLYNRIKRVKVPDTMLGVDFTKWQDTPQQVYLFSSNGIYQLALEEPEFVIPVVDIQTYLKKSGAQHLSKMEFVYNINDDQKADFFTTDLNHSYVHISDETGYQMAKVDLPARLEIEGHSAEIEPPRFAFFDTNEDNISELIGFENGLLNLLPSVGSNPGQAIKLRDDIMVDDWWHTKDADGDSLDQSNLVYRKLERVVDVNHDGIFDLVVRYTKSSGALDRQNDYEIYLGAIEQGKFAFQNQTNSLIQDEGTLTDLQLLDIDNDKQLEALVSGFDIGVSQIIGALLSGSVSQDVHLFYQNEKGEFNPKNKITREVELSFSLSKGRSGSPVVLFADVNGDGKKDWVLSDEQKAFNVYLANNKHSFSRRASKYKTTLPMQGRRVVTSDLNLDGKDDLVMSYGRLDDKNMRKTIKILFATS